MIDSENYENKMMPSSKHGKIKIRNKSKATLHGLKPGAMIDIPTYDGMPADRVWRNRLRDATIDDCVEIVQTMKSKGAK
jgi:hypothetical protein